MTVLEIVAQETGQAVQEDTPIQYLPVDSLEFLELLLTIERHTGVAIPHSRIGELHTIGDIAQIVNAA